MKDYELILGDCIQVMKTIPDDSIDMVLCDPPYGVLRKNNPGAKWDTVIPFDELWKEYRRVCKKSAAIVMFGQGMFTANLMQSNPKMWRYNLIWKKGERVSGFLNANRMPLRNHEDIIVFYDSLPTYNPQMRYAGWHMVNHRSGLSSEDRTNNCYGKFKGKESVKSEYKHPRSVVDFSQEHNKGCHQTQKPVALLEWLIQTYTNPGDVVLDNCMGSGSTGVAAKRTGRRFVGIEITKKWYDVAVERITGASVKKSETQEYQMSMFD